MRGNNWGRCLRKLSDNLLIGTKDAGVFDQGSSVKQLKLKNEMFSEKTMKLEEKEYMDNFSERCQIKQIKVIYEVGLGS